MKINKIMLLGLGVLVVVGIGGYLIINNAQTQKENTDQSQSDLSSEQTGAVKNFVGSIQEAMSMGVGMKCTYEVEGSQYEGYVKGNSYRGMVASAQGISQVIVKDNCVWSWSEDESQGVKMCSDPEDGSDSSVWDNPESGLDTSLNYECSAVAVSDSQFSPPSDIEFIDFEAMMQNMMENIGY